MNQVEAYKEECKKRIELQGKNEKLLKVRLLDLIYLGDWISYYVGVLRGYDPSEIDNIYTLKDRLK